MSSLASSASPRVGPRPRALAATQVSAHTALTWGVALAIAAVSFGAGGGLSLERTTWTEVVLMLAGAALVAGALLTRRIAPPFYGGLTLVGLTALAAYTGAVDHVVAVAERLVAGGEPHVRLRRRRSPARSRSCGSCPGAGRRC